MLPATISPEDLHTISQEVEDEDEEGYRKQILTEKMKNMELIIVKRKRERERERVCLLITKFGTCCSNITPCERECDYIDTESTVRNPEIQYGNQIGRINMECSELELEEERERGERMG